MTIIGKQCLRARSGLFSTVLVVSFAVVAPTVGAFELTYEQALDIALNRSSQADIISGNLEVAERNYFARRVNFYLPAISINGSLPAWESREEYTYPDGGGGSKEIGKRTELDLESFIGLEQSLISGGHLNFRAYLRSNDWEYPRSGLTIEETKRLGSFDLTFDQPILKPSEAKHELHNKKDDYELARLTRTEETATLKKDVAETYVGALEQKLQKQIANEKLTSARLQSEIDSVKFLDGVLSKEDWLISTSARLDAELELYDVQNELSKVMQDLVILLELDSQDDLDLSEPAVLEPIDAAERERLIAAADRSIPILKAEYEFRKAKRAADYVASGTGLEGTLSANYAKNTGRVETSTEGKTDLNLDTWGVKLEFSFPVWDGGAAGASVKASRLEAQKVEIELKRARKAARAEIKNLVDGLDVSTRKLDVLQQQIELARQRLDIARFRYEDGQISRITFLESSVVWLEARQGRLAELKNYLVDMYDLEGKFIN